MNRNRSILSVSLVCALCSLALGCTAPPLESKKGPGGFQPDGNMERAKIPDEYKWQLDVLFADDDAFTAGLAQAETLRTELSQLTAGLEDPAQLRQCLEKYFETRLLTNKLTLYANLRLAADQSSTSAQMNRDKSLQALNELMRGASKIRQQVLALDESALRSAFAQDAQLAEYRPYLEELRRRRSRVLGPEAERVLSLAGDNLWAEIDLNEIPSDLEKAFGALLTDVPLPKIRDERFKPVQLTLSNYGKYRASTDRRVRRETVEKFFKTLKQYQHALAATFAGQVNLNIFMARARGYDRALDAYLDKENIDPAVYTNLIETIHQNLKPLHDYVALRKKVMGLSELHIYDMYTPMVPNVEMNFTFDKAVEILPQALAPLGTQYVDVLKQALDPKNGWLDLYPSKNKESGAFSASVYQVHPFVKMNYYQGYEDLSTLAHEYGHALHSYLSGEHQPYVTYNYAMFIAEIASTMNEKLLSDYMLQHTQSDAEKLYLLNRLVESIRTTIYRQALFAEFELAAHTAAEKGTPLTADFLNETYRKLIGEYYGPGFTIGAEDDIEWAYVPHFYYKFYMFTYATGLSSGIALAERVQSGDAARRDAYLGMLQAGSSKPPLDILRDAGVDLTKPEAITAAAALLEQTIQRMEELISRQPS